MSHAPTTCCEFVVFFVSPLVLLLLLSSGLLQGTGAVGFVPPQSPFVVSCLLIGLYTVYYASLTICW